MIEQLKQIWLGSSPKLRLVTSSAIFLLLALLIFLLLLRGNGSVPSVAPGTSALLNEVLFSPSQNQFQFVELKSLGERGALSGFKLRNEKKQEYVFPENTAVSQSNALLLVTFDGGNSMEGATLHAGPGLFLNRVAGFVEFIAPDGHVLDRVAWGIRQPESVNLGRGGVHGDFVAGTSIGRYPLSAKAVDFLEWLTFSAQEVTPGKSNPNPRVEALLPLDGAYFSQPSIKLSWYPVAGATSYRIQISADSGFSGMLEEGTTKTPPFKTPTLEAGDYFWRVQAVFQDGSSADFSPISSFTISSTELPNFPAQSSFSVFPSAYAAETVAPLREGVLAVPMLYQHKDTAMLLMESNNESGTHAWDTDHEELDESDPADAMNCALASAAMVNHFAGGDLSQDRIGYEIRKDRFPNDPVWDLNYGNGLSYRLNDAAEDQILEALTFAFNAAPVTRHPVTTADAFWEMVTREIDAEKPIMARTAVPDHALVIGGYHQFAHTGPNARWISVNDPWHGRYLVNLDRMANNVTHYWLVSDTSNPRRNEAGITSDSDGDGMVDFDEIERFKTKPGNRDSDQDGVDDKTEVYTTVFDPDHGWAQWRMSESGRDFDEDKRFMEKDPDSDGGGCKDGQEDKNANGKRDGGETYNFNKQDDKCEAGPLGGRVRMTYAYAATRAASCIGRVEINTRFILNPEKIPDAPGIIVTFRADAMTYDIRTDGCEDAPGDHLLYNFSEGFHLSGTLPLTEENGFAVLFPSWPQFSMLLPSELTDPGGAGQLKGTYTTTSGGGPWPAETHVVFEPLEIFSDPTHCTDPGNSQFALPDKLEFCTEPTPCSDQLSAPLECLTEPQRFYVIPFRKSFRWDAPGNEPGDHYHIDDADVTVEICAGCGDEFVN